MKIRRNSHYGESPIACPDGNARCSRAAGEGGRASFWRARGARFFVCCPQNTPPVRGIRGFYEKEICHSYLPCPGGICAPCARRLSYVFRHDGGGTSSSSGTVERCVGMTLLAVMEELQEEGELSFTVSDGMITELNGTKQTPVELLDALHERSGRTPTSSGVPANMRAKCWARPRWARGNSP